MVIVTFCPSVSGNAQELSSASTELASTTTELPAGLPAAVAGGHDAVAEVLGVSFHGVVLSYSFRCRSLHPVAKCSSRRSWSGVVR